MKITDADFMTAWRSLGILAVVNGRGRTICSDCLTIRQKRRAMVHRLIRFENLLDFPLNAWDCARCGHDILNGKLGAVTRELEQRTARLEKKLKRASA